jgi:hypothetical protein
MSILSDVDASYFIGRHLFIIQGLHLFLSLCIEDAYESSAVTHENEIPEQVDTAHDPVILVLRLVEQLFLDLCKLRLNDDLFVHVVIFLFEREQLACLLSKLV